MMWTATISPTRSAARCPASVAALTAATSPRTIAVTKPPPIFSKPTGPTFAALTMASAASTIATKPLVSIIPSASAMTSPLLYFLGLSIDELFADFARQPFDRGDRRLGRRIYLRLRPREPQATEGTIRLDLDQGYLRGLLGLVGGERDVTRRLGLQDEERLPGQDHHPLRAAVDELRLVRLDGADDLIGHHRRLDAIFLAHLEVSQDRGARVAHVPLIVGVDLQQAIGPLDDLDRRHHPGRLERDIGDPVDGDPRRDLDEQRRLPRHRQKTTGSLPHEARQLRLQSIQERVAAECRAGQRAHVTV